MDSKRQATYEPYAASRTGSSYLVDDETRQRLASVGPRARKFVSDGHLTPSANIPSYQGDAVGTLNQQQIREQYLNDLRARPAATIDETVFKRLREEAQDDEGGDTDDDEAAAPAATDYDRKMFIRPSSHRSFSSQTGDFEEADFLRPR